MKPWRTWPLVALVVLFVGLHFSHLAADPPVRYPSGQPARELLWEGPAKAHEARRFGLAGDISTNPADAYHIWSTQSPVYVWPLSGFFRVFGTGYLQLRIFAALIGVVGLAGLYAIGRRHAHLLVAVGACVLYAFSFYNFHLSRGGLLEPYLNTILILAFLAGLLSLERLPWLVASQVALVAALLTKQSAIVALPALAGIGIAAIVAARRRGSPRWQYVLTFASGVVLLIGLLWYVTRPAYSRTLEWNFGHAVLGVEEHHVPSLASLDLPAMLRRLGDPERWGLIYLYVVPAGLLAVVQVGRVLVRALRRAPVELLDLVACVWLASALFTLQLAELVVPRFSIITLPPTALLAASLVASTWRSAGRLAVRAAPLAAAVILVTATDLRWQWDWSRAATYDLHAASRRLSVELDAGSVVIGTKAPALVFDTAAETYYVKKGFNNSATAISRLGVTHLILEQGHPSARFATYFPQEYRSKERRLSVHLAGRSYTLYRLPEQLRATLAFAPARPTADR